MICYHWYAEKANAQAEGGIMKSEDVMTTRVITVTENQTRQQAARLLSQHRISGLPVVTNENVVVGVINEYDIISKEGQEVGEMMTRAGLSIKPDTALGQVSAL